MRVRPAIGPFPEEKRTSGYEVKRAGRRALSPGSRRPAVEWPRIRFPKCFLESCAGHIASIQ